MQHALEQLKEEVERRDASKLSSDELKALIKAATYSGYRLAELKRSKVQDPTPLSLLSLIRTFLLTLSSVFGIC